MKTIEQLEAEITQLQQDLEALKNAPKPIIERTKKYTYISEWFNASIIEDDDKAFGDDSRYESYNYYPADGELCQKVADYLKRTHLFTRKAIEFAGGYEFKRGIANYSVSYSHSLEDFKMYFKDCAKHPQVTYMSRNQAKKFKDWCRAHKKELGYE